MVTSTNTLVEPSSSGIELQSIVAPLTVADNPTKTDDILSGNNVADAVPLRGAVAALQRWNHPQVNAWRTFATFWSFFVVGMNDGSYGVSHQLKHWLLVPC